MAINFVDLGTNATAQQLAAVDALRLQLDQMLGYPKAPTKADGTPYIDVSNPRLGITVTCSGLLSHPADATRFAFPISPEMVPKLAAIRAAIAAKIAQGKASAIETAIQGLPSATALDASWTPVNAQQAQMISP